MIPKEDIEKLAEYDFILTIRNKKESYIGTSIQMDGAKQMGNVFLQDLLVELASALRKGEEEFTDYVKRGVIVQDKDGNWNLNDHSAQEMAGSNVTINNNEVSVVEKITDKIED
jgi:hypothetical protein